ncbi:two-component sensor histidine kinase [Bradyrhizobium sediminis]|uniref:histidine kinase n=1 Tax=Bradyrhizobium sediminis TaxID=2840469 RepID=A0A975RQY1_9BRAD|nr:ATP-binding protein [Bradyrhizobium sediminis]QWG17322.1 two-component sensor histidine kinase [Bradyrhizobium sediminis]
MLILYAAVSGVALTVALWLAGDYGRTRAYEGLKTRARSAADLNATVLRSELEKHRSIPFILSTDPDVEAALTSRDPGKVELLDRKFEGLAEGTRASVIYLLDADGRTLAASNWKTTTSFVGNSYRFRPYYSLAVDKGSAEYFALGTVSRRPGLYISRRVDGPAGVLGIVVVKLEFDQVEAGWGRSDMPSYVTEERGIVLITSNQNWRFMTETPLSAGDAASIRASLQFGEAPLRTLPINKVRDDTFGGHPAQVVAARLPDAKQSGNFLKIEAPVRTTGWQLHLLVPAADAVAGRVSEARLSLGLVLVPILGLGAVLLYRRERTSALAAEAAAARIELEHHVEVRTHDLRQANERLEWEIGERQRTENKLHTLMEDLSQANRLASLGQITAGVAHEINQPVAAIRAYADNARAFLDRDDKMHVQDNLAMIASLTDRIGTITDGLRSFSRKGTGEVGPVSSMEAIEGALLLLGSRIRAQSTSIECHYPIGDLVVSANRTRLEQVLVNLVQNALDATRDSVDGSIHIRLDVAGDEVELSVSDNGPGIPQHVLNTLFTPFRTAKANGLGLGLVISNDIVIDLGGRIDVKRIQERETCFTVVLRRYQ